MVSSNINQICSLISSTASMSHTSIKIVGLGGIRLLSQYLKVHPFYGACFMQTSPHFELIFRVLMGLVYKIKRFCPLNLTSMNDLERFLDKKNFGTRVRLVAHCVAGTRRQRLHLNQLKGERTHPGVRPLKRKTSRAQGGVGLASVARR